MSAIETIRPHLVNVLDSPITTIMLTAWTVVSWAITFPHVDDGAAMAAILAGSSALWQIGKVMIQIRTSVLNTEVKVVAIDKVVFGVPEDPNSGLLSRVLLLEERDRNSNPNFRPADHGYPVPHKRQVK